MFKKTPAPANRMWLQAKPYKFETPQAWADVVRTNFVPLELDILGSGKFINTSVTKDFGTLNVSEIIASSQRVRRTRSLASRAEQALFKLSVQISGRTQIEQDGRVALLNPGDWGLYDTSQPYAVSVDQDSHFLVLQFLAPSLAAWEEQMRLCVGVKFGSATGSARIALDSLRSLLSNGHSLDNCMAESLSANILQMFALSLSTYNAQGDHYLEHGTTIDTVRQSQLQVILRFIHDNLHDASLNATSLAQKFKVSRRYLYNLFAIRNLSPADYIQTARLENCRNLLADPNFNRQISELAHLHGFSDVSTFSHAFRRKFAMSPTDWRISQVGK